MATILLDIETTGLNPRVHGVLEIYAREYPGTREFHALIKPEGYPWTAYCIELHMKNGLTAECMASGRPLPEVMAAFNSWVISLAGRDIKHTLAGKGVGRFDLPFLAQAEPDIINRFQYNTLDIGGLYWRPGEAIKSLAQLAKENGLIQQDHRARGDVFLCMQLLDLWIERNLPQLDQK